MNAFLPGTVPGWLGWGVAVFVAVTAWLTNKRKGDIDESALILTKWKEMVEAHERQVKTITTEVEGLRVRLVKAEAHISELQETVREKNKYIDGLERQIAQNSRSTAVQLQRVAERAVLSDDRQNASDERQTVFSERQNVNDERALHIEDVLQRLDVAGSNSVGRLDDEGEVTP